MMAACDMSEILILAGGAVFLIMVAAFIYEIRHTYRDKDLWKK